MVFEDEVPVYLIEYAKDKLFITMAPNLIYLVDDWSASNVRIIEDTNKDNKLKTFAFPVPNFDIKNRPFIVVCGDKNLTIINVKEESSKTIISKKMS